MADFTATQNGDAQDGATYGNTSPGVEGTDYPDFTGGGDTLNDGGFALTNVAGILGDDTDTPALSISGSVTLSGDLELRPGDEGIAFNDGTLIQGANDIQVEPNDSLARLVSWTGTGTNTWTANGGAIYHSGTRNSSGTCVGFVMTDVNPPPAYLIDIDWDNVRFVGFGSGYTNEGLELHLYTGDSFLWDGGKYVDCGQLRINLAPQGLAKDGTFRIDAVALGAWKGSYGADPNNSPIRLQNFGAGKTTLPRLTNCLIFHDDPTDNYAVWPQYAGDGEMDLSGTIFLNYGLVCEYRDVNMDDCWFVTTTELGDINVGIGRDGTSTQSFNRVSICCAASNPHIPTVDGSGRAVSYPMADLIFDGAGYNHVSDFGDTPLIYNQTVNFTNLLQIHGAGGINPSLNANSTINVDRATFHQAANILCGEGAAAATNDEMIGDVKNCIFSSPITDAMLTDGGGNMATQLNDDIDYNAFIETEMAASNIVHTTLGDDGYFDSDTTGHLSYGVNDIHVTDFEFADDTRHAYVWANSHGYANSEQGLEDAILANFGVTITGGDQAVDPDTTHANYRAYIIAGYTSSNALLSGAGEAGVDIGAFDVAASTPIVEAVGLATETNSALAVGVNKAYALTSVELTEIALAAIPSLTLPPVGLSEETDSALAVAVTKLMGVGQAEETDSALGADPTVQFVLGMAIEVDQALPLQTDEADDTGHWQSLTQPLWRSIWRNTL